MTVTASAPGKVILFGEHAVVYGQPAIAVPVTQLQATASITAADHEFWITAVDLERRFSLDKAGPQDPLARAARLCLRELDQVPPAAELTIRSTIPIASGMGSGAAVTVAILRALSGFLGEELDNEAISRLTFQVEKIHHGTPSGIDNTVVAFGRPVYFSRGRPIETFEIHTPFRLLIADTGIPSSTRVTVGDVRQGWQTRPTHYESLFQQIGELTRRARLAIEDGHVADLGPLMEQNQVLLEELDVSCRPLEKLIHASMAAGADGAKLSGGGRGGNLIVLVQPEVEPRVSEALRLTGAVNVIATWVGGEKPD